METREEVSTPIEEHISLPPPVHPNYTATIQDKITLYLNQLSPIEKMALIIAEEHLGTSFNLQKSIGFIEWSKTS